MKITQPEWNNHSKTNEQRVYCNLERYHNKLVSYNRKQMGKWKVLILRRQSQQESWANHTYNSTSTSTFYIFIFFWWKLPIFPFLRLNLMKLCGMMRSFMAKRRTNVNDHLWWRNEIMQCLRGCWLTIFDISMVAAKLKSPYRIKYRRV
jgi:hypothetical protein